MNCKRLHRQLVALHLSLCARTLFSLSSSLQSVFVYVCALCLRYHRCYHKNKPTKKKKKRRGVLRLHIIAATKWLWSAAIALAVVVPAVAALVVVNRRMTVRLLLLYDGAAPSTVRNSPPHLVRQTPQKQTNPKNLCLCVVSALPLLLPQKQTHPKTKQSGRMT
jgi:hypothetical protein